MGKSATGLEAHQAHILEMKRTPIRKVSKKMAVQKVKERELINVLLERCQGKCEKCGQYPTFLGLAKHEKIHRSQGGDPLDPSNCLMVCSPCHSQAHGIREVRE